MQTDTQTLISQIEKKMRHYGTAHYDANERAFILSLLQQKKEIEVSDVGAARSYFDTLIDLSPVLAKDEMTIKAAYIDGRRDLRSQLSAKDKEKDELLPTKEEILKEAQAIYDEANESADPEAVRQALTMKMMFIAGAWMARAFKKQTEENSLTYPNTITESKIK